MQNKADAQENGIQHSEVHAASRFFLEDFSCATATEQLSADIELAVSKWPILGGDSEQLHCNFPAQSSSKVALMGVADVGEQVDGGWKLFWFMSRPGACPDQVESTQASPRIWPLCIGDRIFFATGLPHCLVLAFEHPAGLVPSTAESAMAWSALNLGISSVPGVAVAQVLSSCISDSSAQASFSARSTSALQAISDYQQLNVKVFADMSGRVFPMKNVPEKICNGGRLWQDSLSKNFQLHAVIAPKEFSDIVSAEVGCQRPATSLARYACSLLDSELSEIVLHSTSNLSLVWYKGSWPDNYSWRGGPAPGYQCPPCSFVWGSEHDPLSRLDVLVSWLGISMSHALEWENESPATQSCTWDTDLAHKVELSCSFHEKADRCACPMGDHLKFLHAASLEASKYASIADIYAESGTFGMLLLKGSQRIRSSESFGSNSNRIILALDDLFLASDKETLRFQDSEESWETMKALGLKSSPPGSLISLFARHSCYLANMESTAVLWTEFVRELRWHWEELIPIERVSDSSPDFRCGILDQKIRMLQLCIRRKVLLNERNSDSLHSSGCDQQDSTEVANSWGDQNLNAFDDDSNCAAVHFGTGRLRRLNMQLIKGGEMYEPEVQPSPPVTEDIFAEQQRILSGLGQDDEAAAMRMHLQSAQLCSDMSAFKAANPDCQIEDFVRWYSPRDWIQIASEDSISTTDGSNVESAESSEIIQQPSSVNGMLSRRMQVKDNIWIKIWSDCDAQAASSQKPLFDVSREAERVLHDLEHVSPSDLWHELLNASITSAFHTLRMNTPQGASVIESCLSDIAELIESCQGSESWSYAQELSGQDQAILQLSDCELKLSQLVSLFKKGFSLEFVQRLHSQLFAAANSEQDRRRCLIAVDYRHQCPKSITASISMAQPIQVDGNPGHMARITWSQADWTGFSAFIGSSSPPKLTIWR